MTTTFKATVRARPRGGISIALPFDPSAEWGDRERYHVTGSVDGHAVRGPLKRTPDGYVLDLGPAWCRDNPVAEGRSVKVVLALEGPVLAADLQAALDAHPDARRFFESLPTFYRKNFVRWIESAKRPETRERRIGETITTLAAGRRER